MAAVRPARLLSGFKPARYISLPTPRRRGILPPPLFRAQPSRAFTLSPFRQSKPFDYDAVSSVADTPRPHTILIDVREPDEYAEGHIPHAINIPVGSQSDALLLPEDEFEDRFGFSKPDAKADTTIFYCRAGVRSKAAAQIAERAGYRNVGEYSGSWLDWTAKGGKVAR